MKEKHIFIILIVFVIVFSIMFFSKIYDVVDKQERAFKITENYYTDF